VKGILALAISSLAVVFAPVAQADELTCDYTGVPIIVALGPVVFVCGNGGVTVNETNSIAPSIQLPVHLGERPAP
jgi:hypothetical protein